MGGELVSVGIPVFNGERTIAAAIESILSQSHSNLEVIISDNGSTDRTGEICQAFAQRDSRIRYVRQNTNIGAVANFVYVLESATGPFFMWAAADDYRSLDFIAVNAAFLAEHPEYVASTSPVRFENDVLDPVRMGDCSLDQGLPEHRVLAFFRRWHANGRFYSLFRRAALVQARALRQTAFLAADWASVLEMARIGKFHRASQGEVILGTKGESSDPEMLRKVRTRRIEYLLPFWRFGGQVFLVARGFTLTARARLFLILVSLNVRCFVEGQRRDFVRCWNRWLKG